MRLASTGIHGPRVVVPIWAQQDPQAFVLPPDRRRQRMSRSVAAAPQLPLASGVLAAPSPLLASATTPAALRACSSRPVPPDSFAAATPFDVLFDPLPLHRERALLGCSAKCSSVLPPAAATVAVEELVRSRMCCSFDVVSCVAFYFHSSTPC